MELKKVSVKLHIAHLHIGTLSALSALALGARQFFRRATVREEIWLPPVASENLYKGGPLVVSRHNFDFGYPRKKLPKTQNSLGVVETPRPTATAKRTTVTRGVRVTSLWR